MNIRDDHAIANRRLGLILFGIFVVLTAFAVSFVWVRSMGR